MAKKRKTKIQVYGTKDGRRSGGVWVTIGKVDTFIGLHVMEEAVEAAKAGKDFLGTMP
jgi:hypothetical protein